MWYFYRLTGRMWLVAVLTVAAFTFAHAYQGRRQVPGLLFVSACFVGMYWLSGSLLVPIVAHIVLDMVQGRLIGRAQRAAAV